MIKRELTEIIIQSITPCSSGLTPTVFKTFLDSPAPIRKSVTVNPTVAALTMCPENSATGAM